MSREMEKVKPEVPEHLRAEKKLSNTEKDMLADEKSQQDFGTEYLSDADLKALIMQIEQQELVMAPPDLKDRILREVQAETKTQTEAEAQVPEEKHALECERPKEKKKILYSQKRKSKTTEFRRYCFRVWTSVAAAILLIFMLPMISGQNADSGKRGGNSNYAVEDLYKKRMGASDYRDSGAFVNSENILQRIFGGSNIFGGEDRLNIFR